jgi:hypothetical protein
MLGKLWLPVSIFESVIIGVDILIIAYFLVESSISLKGHNNDLGILSYIFFLSACFYFNYKVCKFFK